MRITHWLLPPTTIMLHTPPDVGTFRKCNYALLTALFFPLLLNSKPHSLSCLKGLRKKCQNFQRNLLLLQLFFYFIYYGGNSVVFMCVCKRISIMID